MKPGSRNGSARPSTTCCGAEPRPPHGSRRARDSPGCTSKVSYPRARAFRIHDPFAVTTPLSNSAYTRSEHIRALWPWLPLWTAMALLAIFAHGPMPMFSTRTLAVAWEMWAHGHWLVPHINGDPYSEKVPLLFWVVHAGWAVEG